MLSFGKAAKTVFGALLLHRHLKGVDKQLETALIQASPVWLTNLTTRF